MGRGTEGTTKSLKERRHPKIETASADYVSPLPKISLPLLLVRLSVEVRHLWIDEGQYQRARSREVKCRGEIIKSRQLFLRAGNLHTLRFLRSESDMLVLGFECHIP